MTLVTRTPRLRSTVYPGGSEWDFVSKNLVSGKPLYAVVTCDGNGNPLRSQSSPTMDTGITTTTNNTEHVEILEVDSTSHVDIKKAEVTFNELARQLSRHSAARIDQSKQTSRTASVYSGDLEKADEVDKPFDLREYLTSSNDANQAAGIKHKHVGVTWEDLEVKAFGGANHKAGHSFPPLPDWF